MRSLVTLVFAAVPSAFAAIGGKCSGDWGANCICLDKGVCANTWNGRPQQGSAGNWPCPYDADNVWGCYVAPCKGKGVNTVCQWRDWCENSIYGKPLPGESPWLFLSPSSLSYTGHPVRLLATSE